MKRRQRKGFISVILSVIVLTVLSISTFAYSASATAENTLDVNGDGTVNVFDMCLMKHSILYEEGNFKVADIIRLQKFLLGITDDEPSTTTTPSTEPSETTTTTVTSVPTSNEYDLDYIKYSYSNKWMLHNFEDFSLVYSYADINSTQRTRGYIKLQDNDTSEEIIVYATFLKSNELPDIHDGSNQFKFISYFQDTNSNDYYCIWYDDYAKQFVMQYSKQTVKNTRTQIEYKNVIGMGQKVSELKDIVNNCFVTSDMIHGENYELIFEDNVHTYILTMSPDTYFIHSDYIGRAEGINCLVYDIWYDAEDTKFHVEYSWDKELLNPTDVTTTTEVPVETTTTTVTTTAPVTTQPVETTTSEYYFKGSINLNNQVPDNNEFFTTLIHKIMSTQTLERYYISTYDGTIALHYQDVCLIANYKPEGSYNPYSDENLLLNKYIGDSYTSDNSERAILYVNSDTGWFIQLNTVESIKEKIVGTWYPMVTSDYSNQKMFEIFETKLLTNVTEKNGIITMTFEDPFSINYYEFDTSIQKQPDSEFLCWSKLDGIYYRVYKSLSTFSYAVSINSQ